MKINKTLIALIAGASLGMSGQAFAKGTVAGIEVTNSTKLSYKVGDVGQQDIDVNSSFIVDQKIDMTIEDNSVTGNFIPGDSVTYTYALKNTGNAVQYFSLATSNSTTSDDGNITVPTAANITYALVSSLSGDATYDTDILMVPVDDTATYSVKFDFPQTHGAGDIVNDDEFYLLASATAVKIGGGTITPDPLANKNDDITNTTPLIVFAEIASQDSLEQNGAITIETLATATTAYFTDGSPGSTKPGLSIIVINDIICDSNLVSTSSGDYSTDGDDCPNGIADYLPKAIPGAMVKYTIIAKNVGAVTAKDVVFLQNLSTTLGELGGATTDLLPGSVSNISVSFIDGGGTENSSRGATNSTDDSGLDATNVLEVTVPFFEVNDSITITFTALVDSAIQ